MKWIKRIEAVAGRYAEPIRVGLLALVVCLAVADVWGVWQQRVDAHDAVQVHHSRIEKDDIPWHQPGGWLLFSEQTKIRLGWGAVAVIVCLSMIPRVRQWHRESRISSVYVGVFAVGVTVTVAGGIWKLIRECLRGAGCDSLINWIVYAPYSIIVFPICEIIHNLGYIFMGNDQQAGYAVGTLVFLGFVLVIAWFIGELVRFRYRIASHVQTEYLARIGRQQEELLELLYEQQSRQGHQRSRGDHQ